MAGFNLITEAWSRIDSLSISSMQKGVSDQVKDLSRIYGQ